MDKVYAVSEGEYSSYGVHAVFPSRELAEAHVEALNADKSDHAYRAFIEEFRSFDRLPVRMTWYEVGLRMNDDGSYPPEPKVYERTGWEYEAPDGVSMRPQTELLYSQPYRSAFGSSSREEPNPGSTACSATASTSAH